MASKEIATASEEVASLPLRMAESTIYTLVTTADVERGLVSEHGSVGGPLYGEYLVTEFTMRAVGGRTAFVTVSKRMIDTLQDALEKYRSNRSPADVWIIFVEVPANDTREKPIRIHSAEELAEGCGHPNPQQFRHEALVEYSIPWDHVSHRVSLQTLMDRGFIDYLEPPRLKLLSPQWKPTQWNLLEWNPPEGLGKQLWSILTKVFWSDGLRGWTMGVHLAQFVRMFGARAPLGWIANQLFVDCLGFRGDDKDPETDDSDAEVDDKVDEDDKTGSSSWSGRELVSIRDGVETYLAAWLQGSAFVQACTHFKKLEGELQDRILGLEVGFQEDWHIGHGPYTRTLSETDVMAFETSYHRLLAYIELLSKDFEEEAVRLGL